MVLISKATLEESPKPNGVSKERPAIRSNSVSWLVLMKNAFSSALEKTVLKVKFNDERQIQQGLDKITKLLQDIITSQKNLEIGRTESIQTGVVSDFKINNLESLTVENIEGLTSAFKELNPILKTLEESTKSDKQTVGLLNKLISQITQLSNTLRSTANKEVRFPDTQKVSGSVEVSRMPDMQGNIVTALERVEAQLKNLVTKKIPEKKLELAEGKVISDKLDELTDALKKLPGNMEFPTRVSVDNFPPQKIPQPVTNISINALAGTTKSRTVTVGSSTPVPLPGEVLAYRRSLVVYNNSSTITLYVGGSDVSASNGMPVPPNSYSPAFDAGDKMVIYGIAASSSIDVRTLEASDIRTGR